MTSYLYYTLRIPEWDSHRFFCFFVNACNGAEICRKKIDSLFLTKDNFI